jgi:hypothetical protein
MPHPQAPTQLITLVSQDYLPGGFKREKVQRKRAETKRHLPKGIFQPRSEASFF